MDPIADDRDDESDSDLCARHRHVTQLHIKSLRRVERLLLGSGARSRAALWAGSLYFTLLQIESKMRDRKLLQRE